jgi:hypothetical protein
MRKLDNGSPFACKATVPPKLAMDLEKSVFQIAIETLAPRNLFHQGHLSKLVLIAESGAMTQSRRRPHRNFYEV